MSPALSVEVAGVRRATQPAKGGGKNPEVTSADKRTAGSRTAAAGARTLSPPPVLTRPAFAITLLCLFLFVQWLCSLGAWDLRDVRGDSVLDALVSDGATPVARAQISLSRVLSLAAEARALVGGDGAFRCPLTCAKDLSKQQGELTLKCTWTPAQVAAPAPAPAPMQQQPQQQPQQQYQPQQYQQQQQPPTVHRAPTVVMQGQSYPVQQQQQYQPQPVLMQAHPYPQQQLQMAPQMPLMAPPVYVQQQQQPPQPQMMMQPQPVYVQQQQPFSQPAYAAGTHFAPVPQSGPVLLQASPVLMQSPPASGQPATYYAVAPAPAMMPHMSPPVAQWTPAESSADGVFPFSELHITRVIGDGTFGTVSAGEWRGTPVAVKTLKQARFDQQQWTEFMAEVKFLREARHPNIVLFMGVTFNPYSIVTELLDTSLFAVLHQQRRVLTPQQQVHVALGVARGLASLHGHAVPIVHRDIKSLNILVSNDLVSVKICDLGMVKLKAAQGTRLEANGTPLWMAPESVEQRVLLDLPYDEQADVFSFGSLLYEIVTCTVPFGGGNISKEELTQRVGRQGERPLLPPGMAAHFRDLIVQCWQQHPQARPNMKQIVNTLAAIRF